MSRFVNRATTVTVRDDSWDEGESVEIRPRLSFGDKLAIEKSMFTVRTEKGDTHIDAEISAMKQVTLERCIVSWTFLDEAGAPVPVTPETISSLDSETAEFLYGKINEANPAPSKADAQD